MPIDPAVLALADRAHLLGVMSTFANRPTSQWFSAAHPLPSGQLPGNWNDVRSTVTDAQIIETVAVAGPNHCIDGWSFLARAMSAFLSGDLHAARHMAYYSELRAALSILAGVGIGVFNRINFVIDEHGAVHQIEAIGTSGNRPRKGSGTHKDVWAILKEWGKTPAAATLILKNVKIANVPLADCIDQIFPGSSAAAIPISGLLIKTWGVDLNRGEDDHDPRNISSYNPQTFVGLGDSAAFRVKFVDKIWRLFEPAASSFDTVDRHFLRQVFWDLHANRNAARSPEDRTTKVNGPISMRYNSLSASVRGIASLEFLTGKKEPHYPLAMRLAKMRSDPALPEEMIARAFFLMRLATGFTNANFEAAQVSLSSGALRPWLNPVAEARGFWDPQNPLADPLDLWSDINVALEEIAESVSTPPNSLHRWLKDGETGLPTLYETERIGIWSMCA